MPSAALLAPAHVAFRPKSSVVLHRGLLRNTDFAPLPLSGVIVESQLHWFTARVTVRLEFRNPDSESADGFVALDVPENWSVASFRAEVDNQVTGSQYSRRVAAESAKPVVGPRSESARAAATSRLLTAAVPWPIVSGQSCLISIVFVCPAAAVTRESLRFTIPKTIVPINVAVGPSAAEAQQWKNRFTLPAVSRLPKSLLIHGKGQLYCAAQANPTVSQSGATAVKAADPRRIEFKYDNRDNVQQPSSNFDVNVKIVPDEDPVMIHAVQDDSPLVHADDRYALAISIAPPSATTGAAPPANIELTLLVDNSGSTVQIAERLRSAAKAFLHGLPAATVVNVGLFGDATRWVLNESQLLNDETLDQLTRGLDLLRGDGGASKIYRALTEAYLKPVVTGYARLVVLVTDGAEGTPFLQRSLELASANRHTTKFCAVTVGDCSDPSSYAFAAAVSNGTAIHAATASEVLPALVRCVKPHLVPHLTFSSVHFSYDGVDEKPPVRLCVDNLPLIPIGERAVVYAFGSRTMRGCTARVTSLVGNEQREYTLHTGPIEKSDTVTSKELDASSVSLPHVAAATQRIDTLVNFSSKSALSAQERDEVLRLSERFAVPSPFTELGATNGGSITYPFNELRETFPEPSAAPYRDPLTGAAKDADTIAQPELVLPTQTQRILGWSQTHAVALGVVNDVVGNVCQPFDLESVLALQKADGSFSGEDAVLPQLLNLKTSEFVAAKPEDADAGAWATVVTQAALLKKVKSDDPAVALALPKIAARLEKDPKKASLTAAAVEFTMGRL